MIKETKNVIGIYNEVSEDYYNLCSGYFNYRAETEKFLSLLDGKKILDAGCGFGKYSRFLIEKGFEPLGVDLSEQLLEYARKDVPKGKFEKVDISDLPYTDNSFDGIIAMFSLQHIPTKLLGKTIQGFRSVLKPEGKIIIGVQEGDVEGFTDEPFRPSKKIFTNLKPIEKWINILTKMNFEIIENKFVYPETNMDFTGRNIIIIAKSIK